MFCPGCGLENAQANQFCRACGTDLRVVRFALESPDGVTASAISAREEIGRAVAAKIRETTSAYELKKVAEDVLPEIEKFLESPEERRMRRIRVGTTLSSIGLGAAIAFSILGAMTKSDVFVVAGMGVICFFIGLGFMLNGLLFTVPKKTLSDKSPEAKSQRELDTKTTNELILPESHNIFTSVTEHTTHQLKKKDPLPRR